VQRSAAVQIQPSHRQGVEQRAERQIDVQSTAEVGPRRTLAVVDQPDSFLGAGEGDMLLAYRPSDPDGQPLDHTGLISGQ
jgi:hypothetical protein